MVFRCTFIFLNLLPLLPLDTGGSKTSGGDVKKMCIEKEKENEMQVRMDRQTASSVLERRW